MRFVENDGGRAAAGYSGTTGDCVCRAVVIASGRSYQEVYGVLANGNVTERRTKRSRKPRQRSAANGIRTKRKWFKDYMLSLGFTWHPIMTIGSGCTIHLRDGELPMGRLVVSLSKHVAAVIDGVLHDTYQDDRDGTRCVYGYWKAPD